MIFRYRIVNKLLNVIIEFINSILSKKTFSFLIILKRFLINLNADVIFLVEDIDWAIKRVGKSIVLNLKRSNLINAEIDRRYSCKNKIIHYGSINCLIRENSIIKIDKSNKHILTFFHISSEDYYVKYINYLRKKIDLLHTSNNITKQKLIELGFEAKQIIVIPLGVDLSLFNQYNQDLRSKIRKKFKLPQDKIIIGSFQKDGVGWKEGYKPKLVKGPDIFCEVVNKLKDDFKIHIFLAGPARGYVKKRLDTYGISYTHVILDNYEEIVDCYNALDLYIVTSRVEGGPLALLESMATGVPIISTKVGMAPEIIKNNVNGFIAEINSVNQLVEFSKRVIEHTELREKIIKNSLKSIQNYSWENISRQYYEKLYKRFLTKES